MPSSARNRLQTASWFAVVRAYQECNRRYARLLGGFDLTIPQFDVLTAIRGLADQATPKAIADELVVTRGNITGVLQRLQERELVATHEHDSDGRSFVCKLTRQGLVLLARARAAAAIFIEQQLAPFDDDNLRDTLIMMQRMRAHLQSIDADAIVDYVIGRPASVRRTAPGG